MVPESAKDPLLPQPPVAGALGAEESHLRSGGAAQAVYFSNPTPPQFCYYFVQGPETSSVSLEVPTPSPDLHSDCFIAMVTYPWL